MTSTWLAIGIFVAVFGLMHQGELDRRMVMLGGAAIMLLVGWGAGFYTPVMAMEAVYFDTLALIFGMSMISATLTRSGYFAALALRIAGMVQGNGWAILVLGSLLTYTVSLAVNNLAAMLMILPVTLPLCRASRVDPVPVVVAEIIASNLGGASTMIGDFPNMIIAGVAHLHFLDFIGGMMAPCLLLLAMMLLFFQMRRSDPGEDVARAADQRVRHEMFAEIHRTIIQPGEKIAGGTIPGNGLVDPGLYRLGMTTLILSLSGFLATGWLPLPSPAWIAFGAGLVLMIFGRFPLATRFNAMGGGDILFFLGLFVMVGGLQAAGVLNGVSWLIDHLGGGSAVGRLLALMWIAGLLTLFLNAGPATAFFIPIVREMSAVSPGPAVWWALSLGVLAGSSAALTGATAGSVAASQVEGYLQRYPDFARCLSNGQGLTFREYLRWGLPIMLLFLVMSTCYVLIIGPS